MLAYGILHIIPDPVVTRDLIRAVPDRHNLAFGIKAKVNTQSAEHTFCRRWDHKPAGLPLTWNHRLRRSISKIVILPSNSSVIFCTASV